MKRSTILTIGGLAVALAISAGGTYFAMSKGAHGMMAGMHGHGADGTGHDEVNMPGLRGENATAQESEELAIMFRNFDTITREVENLPNGIRTVTRSSDQTVMDALVSHSVGMIDRVGQLDDPKIMIQSPTLSMFFVRGESIASDVEVTDAGLVVIQTSDDPDMVAALHKHAAEVTDMVNRGMAAVHDMMMENGTTH